MDRHDRAGRRHASPVVRNPILALPGTARLLQLDPHTRTLLRTVLLDLAADKQPHRTLRPDRVYRPPPRSAPKPFAWESMGTWVRLMHRLFALEEPSSDHYRRSRETARELTVARARECRHDDDLARIEQMLVEARSGWLYGLDRAFTRAERGELLVEVRNRRRLLVLGRSEPKPKGARFDLARLPQAALKRLIQSHPDPYLVDRMRAERSRRSRSD